MIVVFAQMAQDQRAGAGVQDFANEVAGDLVREVSHAAHHALLHRPGIRADLQHLDVVVGFEEKEIRGAKMPLDRLRDVSQVRRNSYRAAAEPETEPDRIDRVVRDRKRCYADVADEKNGAGLKCFDDGFASVPVNPGSREIRKVDRNLPEPVGQKRRCGSCLLYTSPSPRDS